MGHVYYRKQKRTGWKNSVYAVHNEIESVKTYIFEHYSSYFSIYFIKQIARGSACGIFSS